jgi:hypothetical protein
MNGRAPRQGNAPDQRVFLEALVDVLALLAPYEPRVLQYEQVFGDGRLGHY